MKQKILVITATLGDRESLRTTIESVRAVGGERVKHVLVCPEERIARIKEKYGDIECLAEPAGRRGIYAALNHGFRTYGEEFDYMTFINDDDHWLPDYAKLIDVITSDKSLDLVYGRTIYVNSDGVKIGSQTSYGNFKAFAPLLHRGIILLTQQATIIRSSLYFRIGGFDESYKLVADTKFWVEASLLDIKYKYVNRECAAYMIQSGQLSSDKTTQGREHERLMTEFPSLKELPSEVIRFRLANVVIYLKRFFKHKGYIKNPFTPPVY